MMILDTHTLVWLDEGNPLLGRRSLSVIDEALKASALFVSTVSFWEVAMLVDKGRLEMRLDVNLWRQALLSHGLQEIALCGEIAISAALLTNFHGDPADRMIVASALHSTATLCTADKRILSWTNNLVRLDARK